MKTIKYFAFLLLIAFFGSCDGTVTRNGERNNSRSSYSLRQVQKNIEELSTQPWDKQAYENIRDNQVASLKQSTERRQALASLNDAYSKVLLREATAILDEGCTRQGAHKTLDAVMTELKDFDGVIGYEDIVARKDNHDKALAVANKQLPYQTVNSYIATYDASKESQMISEAKTWLAKSDVKCQPTRELLKKKSEASYYTGHRQKFCEKVVAQYKKTEEPIEAEKNKARKSLKTASPPNLSHYQEQVESHYRNLELQ